MKIYVKFSVALLRKPTGVRIFTINHSIFTVELRFQRFSAWGPWQHGAINDARPWPCAPLRAELCSS
jgi:hypothetical protein